MIEAVEEPITWNGGSSVRSPPPPPPEEWGRDPRALQQAIAGTGGTFMA